MLKRIKIISKSAAQTKDIARKIAQFLRSKNITPRAMVIGLKGELGGGKTTFIQGFAPVFGIKEKILSPTFVIMKNFDVNDKKGKFSKIYHFDVYRVNEEKEIKNIGFKEIIKDPKNLVLIEWANLIKKTMPKDSISINFEFKDENTRNITIDFPSIDMFNEFKMLKLEQYGRK